MEKNHKKDKLLVQVRLTDLRRVDLPNFLGATATNDARFRIEANLDAMQIELRKASLKKSKKDRS